MNAFAFAWRSLVRQPARAVLGVLGVAAVGALLFDMLLLSRGLVVSMEQLLDRSGFDIRVSTAGARPGLGQPLTDASAAAARIASLREVAGTMPVRLEEAEIREPRVTAAAWTALIGSDPSHRHAWTVVDGRDLRDSGEPEVLLNRNLAAALGQRPGGTMTVRSSCHGGRTAIPPTRLRVVGVAEFPFDNINEMSALVTLQDLDRICGGQGRDVADEILVSTARGGSQEAAMRAIERLRPDLQVMSNAQLIERFQGELSYFRQISLVLVVVTVGFALLLVAVLLTVSVNQRLGEIAALRALGFSQRRVVADVLCESALLVGTGAVLALPVGLVLARGLDWILKAIPGIPGELHFFVFQPRAVVIHVALFVATALLAAAYPMQLVARLPIAGTLRKEIVS